MTQERWEKTQVKIRWLAAQVREFDEASFLMLDMDKVEEERRETPAGKQVSGKLI